MSTTLSLAGMFLAVAANGSSGSAPVRGVEEGFYWIAPEDFVFRGGWKLDTQFIHLMGSSCLLAAGALDPVEDAWTTVDVAKAGRYRAWVRMRDWLPAYHPGRFQLLVNGEALPGTLGEAERDDWHWAAAGDLDLDQGPVRIALHDLTGGFGRCAAVLLASATDYVPPHEVEDMVRERARLKGIDMRPEALGHFEVIVVGGGPAGCPAAIAAARLGARTALFQDRPVLGGNASNELGVPPEGASMLHPNARETGIIEEASRLRVHGGYSQMSEPFRILAEAEPNLTVYLNTRVIGVDMASSAEIKGVLGMDVTDGSYVSASADYVIDCTGDGWVGYYAGARYRVGREAKWEFGEADAPEQPDNVTMSGCLMGGRGLCYWAEDTGHPVAYKAPAWAAEIPDLATISRRPSLIFTGEWWLEHPGSRDDLYNAEEARDELIRISFGYWDYVKNVWAERHRAANYQLTEVPYLNAKRETRRLMGDYVLTQNDVLDGRLFDDAVAYAGWPLDIHAPEGIYGGPKGPYFCNHLFESVRQLPFSILYSKNVGNLLFAGRCASVTHLALGTVRVERTLASLGQAAGTAAALCVKYDCDPRVLRQNHMTELQQTLLKNDQFIPGVSNQDPGDLARSATVAASSTAQGEVLTRDKIQSGKTYHDMAQHRRACILPATGIRKVERADLLLRSDRSKPVTGLLHLREASSFDDLSSTQDVAVAEGVIAPGEHWTAFVFNKAVAAPYVWVWLEAIEGVAWPLTETPFPWARRAYAVKGADGADAWVVRPENYVCCIEPPAQVKVDYRPENVINGWSRIIGSTPNMWRSAPGEAMPQWIELSFPNPVAINTVQVAFGTDLNSRHLERVRTSDTGPAALAGATAYEIQVHDGSQWRSVVHEEGNFQRWRRHQFTKATVAKLRLVIHAVGHMDSAQVYELRAYCE
jgi:hypothetical protein